MRKHTFSFFHRHRERIKTVLLVGLIIALFVQSGILWSRGLTRESIPWDGVQIYAAGNATQKIDHRAGAMPVRFAVRNEQGLYGIQYNTDGLEMAYEETAELWAQACANAGEAVAVTDKTYRKALQQQMVMMQYDGRIPMEVIAGWLSCDLPESLCEYVVGTMALCRNDDTYSLYVHDSAKNQLICVPTTVTTALFDTVTAQFEPNDCTLAADETKSIASADVLYFSGGETFDVMSFQPYTGGDGMRQLLTAFEMDAENALNRAYAADDVMVYVSGNRSIHMAQDGSMRYRGKMYLPAKNAQWNMQCVQMGFELTSQVLEAIDCGASPALTSAYIDTDSARLIVVYGIQIDGIPVDNAVTGYFARYEFEQNALVQANLALRTCQSTGDTLTIMPEKQVIASLGQGKDAQISLRYVDAAVGTNSSWEQTYQKDAQPSDDVWNVENQGEDNWQDMPSEGQSNDTWETQWYDNAGTPIAPQWYVLQYGDTKHLPKFGRTLSKEEIVYVQPDFDRMIQGGNAS